MTPERWHRVTALYTAALALEPGERAAFLDVACGADADLRRDVEALVAAHERTGEFLERPAFEIAVESTTVPEASQPVPEDSLPGITLDGKYFVGEAIGKGGMGAVYRATHLQLHRDVAVKVLRGGALDRLAEERFTREALAVARLKHPNIVAIYDIGTTPGVGTYLVMELLTGRTLRAELTRRRRLPVSEVVGLARQLLAAVQTAHDAGVLHRDLKPENLFLEEVSEGRVLKVVDFGIAKLVGSSPAHFAPFGETQQGVVMGTPSYLAPERWLGVTDDVRSDIFAIGCVVYEMLTGQLPFGKETVRRRLFDAFDPGPTPPSAVAVDVPPELDRAILRALAREPAERFQTAREFARALEKCDVHQPPLAEADTLALTGATTEAGDRATAATPSRLPHVATRFVGRRGQVREIRSALANTPILTLTGPGGIGKTRLAIEAASAVINEHPDGVWFVELAPVTRAESIPDEIAAVVEVRESRETSAAALDTLVRWFAPRRTLLVLDNCEHLLDACARTADELVRACPGLRLLVTSREPLAVPGETVWIVQPLTVPDAGAPVSPNALEECDAVELFLDRAATARAGFALDERDYEPLAQIIRRLDGIPLAIELAAARTRALSIAQIAAKLDDRFSLLTTGSRVALPRQQTLRAAVDWSYNLLSEEEQALFRRLSIFADGWTLDAAEGVIGPLSAVSSPPPSEQRTADSGQRTDAVFDILSRLVDKSLVVATLGEHPRYGMLETLRQYAAEKLEESGETGRMRAAHLVWFLKFADEGHAALDTPGQAEWLVRLEADHDNLRAALDEAERSGNVELRLEALRRAHQVLGFLRPLARGPGATRANARGRRGPPADSPARAVAPLDRALRGLSRRLRGRGRPGRAQPRHLARGRRSGRVDAVAPPVRGSQDARRKYRGSQATGVGLPRGRARARGRQHDRPGGEPPRPDRPAPRRLLRGRALVRSVPGGAPRDRARRQYRRGAAQHRGGAALSRGRRRRQAPLSREPPACGGARRLAGRRARPARARRDGAGRRRQRGSRGALPKEPGRRPAARRPRAGGLLLRESRGARQHPRRRAGSPGALPPGARARPHARQQGADPILPGWLRERGRGARGARAPAMMLAGAAAAVRDTLGVIAPPSWRRDLLDRNLAPAREALGPDEARRHFDEGRALTVDEAIARALGE